jgi:hypothetical protein
LSRKNKIAEEPDIQKPASRDLVTWSVFLFSISICLISFVAVIFPALLVVSDTLIIPGLEPVTPDPFETGPWSGAVIAVNVIIFGLIFLYFKGKLPKPISSGLVKLFNFEVSKRTAIIVIAVLLVIYISATVPELSTVEKWEDYIGVKGKLDSWSFEQISRSVEPQVKFFLTWASMEIFGNYKIIPFLASISLLLGVYFITAAISEKRFAGIIAMVILMQSSVFFTFDTSVAYTNFWILFYLLSLYSVLRIWPLSPTLYVLSIPSKYLTAAFLPLSLFFIYRSSLPTKKKIHILISYAAIFLMIVGIAAALNLNLLGIAGSEGFSSDEFWIGFTSFAIQLRFDGIVLLFMIPLIVGLFLVSKNGVKHGDSIMVLISGMLLFAPLLTGFTNQTNQPYRFVPLVVFFAVGVGILLSKKKV